MATGRIRPTWVPPSSGDAGLFTFGVDVQADANQDVSGMWWYQPPAPGAVTNVTLSLYVQATQALLDANATVVLASGSITAGAWNFAAFPAVVTMAGGTLYTMVATCSGEHGYQDPAGYPIDDPSNTVHLPGPGRFQGGAGPYPGASTWGGQHGMDVEMVEGEPANATLALTAPMGVLALTAAAEVAATLNLQAPRPTLSLTAQAVANATLNLTAPTPTLQLTATRGVTPGGGGIVDGPCNWEIDTSCVEAWDELPASAQLVGYNLATYQLWALTGRRFGQCEITVQPCQQRKRLPLYLTYPVPGYGMYGSSYSGGGGPVIEDGQWFNRCWGGCRCRARCETPLDGPTTTDAILQVTVRGEVVDPSAYQVQNGYLLVRTDGECWPTCVDYSKQDPPEFTVTYLRGDPLFPALQTAAGLLAYEYALSCIGDDRCRLPAQLQSLSRQGVTVQVAPGSSYLDFGMTNIPEVDKLIIAVNPYRAMERPQVLSPDRPRPRMVT